MNNMKFLIFQQQKIHIFAITTINSTLKFYKEIFFARYISKLLIIVM